MSEMRSLYESENTTVLFARMDYRMGVPLRAFFRFRNAGNDCNDRFGVPNADV